MRLLADSVCLSVCFCPYEEVPGHPTPTALSDLEASRHVPASGHAVKWGGVPPACRRRGASSKLLRVYVSASVSACVIGMCLSRASRVFQEATEFSGFSLRRVPFDLRQPLRHQAGQEMSP